MTETNLPLVAIVGRPNVGKSTLMNRILGRREAIVEERAGVTRDRKEATTDWNGYPFRLVDTGGWLAGGDDLDAKVSRQSEAALAEADLTLFVVDTVVGVTEEDAQFAELLRRRGKPVLLVSNKVDDTAREAGVWEFMSLGLGEPFAVSALHGRGAGDLLDRVVEELTRTVGPPPPLEGDVDQASLRARSGDAEADRVFAVALVGRPNVGKSTLFNRLIGSERAVVHDMPGTTRDTIDTIVETDNGPIRFVDTAGMRRRTRVEAGTEYFSIVRALKAVDSSDIALLVIDATESITHQDQRLAERVDAAGCPVVVILNKWELLDTEEREKVSIAVGRQLSFLGDSAVLKISALTGKGVHQLLPVLGEVVDAYHRRVPTRRVNEVIAKAQAMQPAPHGARVLYATQGAVDPPTFTLFANRELHHTYLRYLERSLREAFDLGRTPIKLRVRKRTS